jgi:ABC-type phosphate transport system substrate-binding protein
VVTDRGITSQAEEYANLVQFPLAGQAMVIGYNLPELNSTDPTLVRFPSTSTIVSFVP